MQLHALIEHQGRAAQSLGLCWRWVGVHMGKQLCILAGVPLTSLHRANKSAAELRGRCIVRGAG